MTVDVFALRGNSRSQKIAFALALGAKRAGYPVVVNLDNEYIKPQGTIAAFYGFKKNMPQIMEEYVASGRKVVFVDLGYWGRRRSGRYKGYHKIAVNGRHPGDYMMEKDRDGWRFQLFGLRLKRWAKQGEHILLAGMSAKSAESLGYQPEEWERWAIREIRKHSDRDIVYRPKPSWTGATHLEGATTRRGSQLDRVLDDCHAVVTHHSNVAIDGLVYGVPSFCWQGAAVPMSLQDLSLIEEPIMPDGRKQWLYNVAWCQWSVEEMTNGQMWRYLKNEGLIP